MPLQLLDPAVAGDLGVTAMQVYVDDPVLVVRGCPRTRRDQVAILMLAWSVLGISLAIRKANMPASPARV